MVGQGSKPAQANREIVQISNNIIVAYGTFDMKHFAKEVKKTVFDPVQGKEVTEGEKKRFVLQLRRVFGELNFTAFYGKLKLKVWTGEGICNGFWTEFLRFVYGDAVIAGLEFPNGLGVVAKGELMCLKNPGNPRSTQRILNLAFFTTHNLDVNVFLAKIDACVNNPQGEFPVWLRDHRGWGGVLLTTPPYSAPLPLPLPPPPPPAAAPAGAAAASTAAGNVDDAAALAPALASAGTLFQPTPASLQPPAPPPPMASITPPPPPPPVLLVTAHTLLIAAHAPAATASTAAAASSPTSSSSSRCPQGPSNAGASSPTTTPTLEPAPPGDPPSSGCSLVPIRGWD